MLNLYQSSHLYLHLHLQLQNQNEKKERRHFWGCGAGVGRVAVTPDGLIYPCSRFAGSLDERYIIGHIEEGFYKSRLPEAIRAGEWARHKCSKCHLAEICSGGCPAVNLEATGSLYEPPKAYCAEVKAWANAISKLPESAFPKTNGQEKPCPLEG